MIKKLTACAATSGKPRLEALHKLQSKNRSGSVRATSALVKAGIPAAESLEEIRHGVILVNRARKNVREASGGESRRNLGVTPPRSADAGDIRTCKMRAGVVSDWYRCLLYYLRAGKKKPNVQVGGKRGWNWTTSEPSFFLQSPPPTPSSPLAKSRLTPRAPSCAKRSHTLFA